MKPKNYEVTFSYTINVTAKDKDTAEMLASRKWDDIMPRTDEMNIEAVQE